MVTRSYETRLSLTIVPLWKDTAPRIKIHVNDTCEFDDVWAETGIWTWRGNLPQGEHWLHVELYDKNDMDSTQSLQVKDIVLNDIPSDDAVYQSLYRPIYPEPWASQQVQQGHTLSPVLTGVDYLGWNGRWSLKLEIPVFTWIHKIQNLGWIYD